MRKKAWITATAVVLVSAGAVGVMQLGGFGRGQGIDPTSLAGIHLGRVDTVNLTSTSSTQAGLPARKTKHQFTTIGVTWNQATTQLDGTVQVRTRSVATGEWSDWSSLDRDDTGAPGGHASRGGTAPMWVGLSDGVEVRVRAADGSTSLPAGLNVALVDPNANADSTSLMAFQAPAAPADTPSPGATDTSAPTDTPTASPTDTATAGPSTEPTASPTDSATTSPSDSASPTSTASPTASASASATPSPSATTSNELPTLAQAYPAGCPNTPTTGQTKPNPLPKDTSSPLPTPPIVSRAGWQADECVRKAGYPAYGDQGVKVVFVHHTVDHNDYNCSDSPALVRGAYLYHVKTEGWDDIGYNFLVDKCGTIFEGRFGSPWLPVTGAQTYGFNTNSMGIAAIGTYTDLSGGDSGQSTIPGATPTDAMLRSIAWIAAWKLGMYGIDPVTGTNQLPEGGSGQKWPVGTLVTFKAISGHRDGYATDCPGNQLYNDLDQIRSYAKYPASFETSITKLDGGAVRFNSEWVTRSAATVHWTVPKATSDVSGFEVLADGVSVAKTDGTASSAAITLSGSGTHQVAVQTDYASGNTVKSAAVPVFVDTVAPTFAAPPLPLMRTGATATTTAMPVVVSWGAAKDNTALATNGVAATSPIAATFASTATSWNTTAKPGTGNVFALKATDIAGNVGTTSSDSRTASYLLPASGTRTGTWTRHNNAVWLGGYSYFATAAGASISFKVTGRAVSLIATRAANAGGAYIYSDGVKIAGINLNNASTLYRQVVWQGHWATSGTHTIKIVVAGTAGHPTVPIEALALLG